MKNESAYRRSMPPWIWFYIIISIFYIPYYSYYISTSLDSIIKESANSQVLGPIWPILNAWITLGELLPLVVIILGILTLLLPRVRAKYISRKYNLPDKVVYDVDSLSEIRAFVGQMAPNLVIKANLLRTDQIAFIYPLGFRKTALAIFGGLIRLWKSDRKAAEAILLHEIGHYRQGDSLILGVGSFFGYLINNWFKLTLIFILIPILLLPIAYAFAQGSGIYGMVNLIVSVIISIPNFFIIYSTELLSFIILPIMAIWSAEINADRYMINQRKAEKDSLKVIDGLSEDRSIFKNLLIDPTHPPKNIRRRLLTSNSSISRLTFSIILFPLGFLVRFILLEIWAIGSYLMDSSLGLQGFDSVVSHSISNFAIYFGDTMPTTWICLALMIAIWPFIENRWYYFFAGTKETQTIKDIKGYMTSSFIVIILLFISYGIAKGL
jgi:Zn-dependent protease with chaperone function